LRTMNVVVPHSASGGAYCGMLDVAAGRAASASLAPALSQTSSVAPAEVSSESQVVAAGLETLPSSVTSMAAISALQAEALHRSRALWRSCSRCDAPVPPCVGVWQGCCCQWNALVP